MREGKSLGTRLFVVELVELGAVHEGFESFVFPRLLLVADFLRRRLRRLRHSFDFGFLVLARDHLFLLLLECFDFSLVQVELSDGDAL